MGGRKSGAFGNSVGELTTMLDANTNPKSAKVFGDIQKADLIASLKTVVAIKRNDIEAALSSAGFEGYNKDKLLEILLARQDFIKKHIAKLESSAPKTVGGIHDKFTWAHNEPTAKDIQAFNFKWGKAGANYKNELTKLKQLAPSLTDEEAMALVLYTNGHYGALNRNLRTREEEMANVTTFSAFSRILNSAIRKATKEKALAVKGEATGPWENAKAEYYERKTTISGAGLEAFRGKYKKGKQTYIDSFLSTSRTRTSFSGNVHIYFKPKNGYAYCDEFSCHRGEDEVVVPVGVKVEVEHVMSDQYGNTIVYLKEI
jgi:hypothetical protein